jgi:hypothetical protein
MADETVTAKNQETVTVALKHPHGLILRLFEMVPDVELVMGGGTREIKKARPVPGQVRINGYAERNTKIAMPATSGRFALTHNVPKSFWDRWLAQNKGHDFVEKGLIFAGSPGNVSAQIKDHEKVRSGFEPIDPEKPPVAGVTTYDKEAA